MFCKGPLGKLIGVVWCVFGHKHMFLMCRKHMSFWRAASGEIDKCFWALIGASGVLIGVFGVSLAC